MKISLPFNSQSRSIKLNVLNSNGSNSFGDGQLRAKINCIQYVEKIVDAVYYDGSYNVTPKLETQILETKQKFMKNNVTIKEVPVFRTTNSSGGTTVYIAKKDV